MMQTLNEDSYFKYPQKQRYDRDRDLDVLEKFQNSRNRNNEF